MQNACLAIRDSQLLFGDNPMRYLNYLRDMKNAAAPRHPDRIAWPSGKLPFATFVEKNGGRAPRSLAILEEGRVVAGAFGVGEGVDSFVGRLPPGRYFCKPNRAAKGAGGFTLDIADAGALVNGEKQSLASIEVLLSDSPYVVQESLTPQQHPEIARFNPRTINTVRLVTFDTESGPAMFAASLRMAIESAAVDNWSAGGVMVPIDLERGVLERFGTIKEGLALVDAHPQSGQKFCGQSVPYLREAANMACLLHRRLNLWSVSWDIALLESGPCIVEANRKWSVYMGQFNLDFLRTFFEFHLSHGTDAIRMELSGSFTPRVAVRHWLTAVMGAARVSARVDELSNEHLIVTVGGSRAAIESAMDYMRRSARDFGAGEIRFAPAEKPVLSGLDVGAAFSP